MSKRRKNQFKEALDAKREALTRAANQPGASSRYRGGGRRMRPSGQERQLKGGRGF
jgi:hypothetical protein